MCCVRVRPNWFGELRSLRTMLCRATACHSALVQGVTWRATYLLNACTARTVLIRRRLSRAVPAGGNPQAVPSEPAAAAAARTGAARRRALEVGPPEPG